jgi:hypothetical protein
VDLVEKRGWECFNTVPFGFIFNEMTVSNVSTAGFYFDGVGERGFCCKTNQ